MTNPWEIDWDVPEEAPAKVMPWEVDWDMSQTPSLAPDTSQRPTGRMLAMETPETPAEVASSPLASLLVEGRGPGMASAGQLSPDPLHNTSVDPLSAPPMVAPQSPEVNLPPLSAAEIMAARLMQAPVSGPGPEVARPVPPQIDPLLGARINPLSAPAMQAPQFPQVGAGVPVADLTPEAPGAPMNFRGQQAQPVQSQAPVRPGMTDAPREIPQGTIPYREDQSTALGDLRAGGLMLQQMKPGAQMIGANRTVRRSDQVTDQAAQERDALTAEADALEQTLKSRRSEMSPDDVDYMRDQIISLRQRAQSMDTSANLTSTKNEALMQFSDAALENALLMAEINKIPMNPAAKELAGADTWGETLEAFRKDPMGVTRTFTLRSLPASSPSIVGAVVGQFFGGPAGAALLSGAAGGSTELTLSVSQDVYEGMAKSGVDVSNPEATQNWIDSNPEVFADIMQTAMIRAGVISAADAATAGLAGKLIASVRNASAGTRAATAAGTGAVLEPAGEMTGEGLAQVASGQEFRPGEVIAEGLGAGGQGVVTTTGQTIAESRRAPPKVEAFKQFGKEVDTFEPVQSPEEVALQRLQPPQSDQPVQRMQPSRPVDPTPDQTPSVVPAANSTVEPSQEEPLEQTPQTDVPAPPAQTGDSVAGPTQQATSQQAVSQQAASAPRSNWVEFKGSQIANSPQGQMLQVEPSEGAFQAMVNGQPVGTAPNMEDAMRAAEVAAYQFSQAEGFNPPQAPTETPLGRSQRIEQSMRQEPTSEPVAAPIGQEPPAETPSQEPYNQQGIPAPRAESGQSVGETAVFQTDRGLVASGDGAFSNAPVGEFEVDGFRTWRGDAPPAQVFEKTMLINGEEVPVIGIVEGRKDAFMRAGFRGAVARIGDDGRGAALRRASDKFKEQYGKDPGLVPAAEPKSAPTTEQVTEQAGAVTSQGDLDAMTERMAQDGMPFSATAARDRFNSEMDEIIAALEGYEGEQLTLNYTLRRPSGNTTYKIANATPERVADFRDRMGKTTPISEAYRTEGNKGSITVEQILADRMGQISDPVTGEMRPAKPSDVTDEMVEDYGQELGREVSRTEKISFAKQKQPKGQPRNKVTPTNKFSDAGDTRRVGRTFPGGSLSPSFSAMSFLDQPSVFGDAFREAGHDPDKAINYAPARQIEILREVIKDKYGITVELPTKLVRRKNIAGREVRTSRTQIDTRRAIDQLLDAYRQLNMLAHVIALPKSALQLKGKHGDTLSLSLVGTGRGPLGTYGFEANMLGEVSGRMIKLPGRSRSFAHEWGHALDHFINMTIREENQTTLFTRDAMKTGTEGTSNERVADAFVGVMRSMFGDAAELAAYQIDLEIQATATNAKGKPTREALKAQKDLATIKKGGIPKDARTSKYFKSSSAFDTMYNMNGYFIDPAEMFARSFEAYVGTRAEMVSDLPAGFLAKSDWAYTGSDDPRAAMTFPKGVEADQIFVAMDSLMTALREQAVFGPDAVMEKPRDANIYDSRYWDEWVPDSLLKTERNAWRKIEGDLRDLKKDPRGLKTAVDSGQWIARPTWRYLRNLVNRQPEAARVPLLKAIDMFMTDPGSGRAQAGKVNWEQAVERKFRRTVSRFNNIVERYNLERVAVPGTKGEKELRRALTDGNYDAPTKEIREAAPHLRRLLDQEWYYLQQAGVKVGYARNGYLPRIIDNDVVQRNAEGFVDAAAKVYKIIFRQDVRNSDFDSQIDDVAALARDLSSTSRASDGERFKLNLFTSSQVKKISTWMDHVSDYKSARRRASAALREAEKQRQAGNMRAASEASKKADEASKDAAKAKAKIEETHNEILNIVDATWSREEARRWKSRLTVGGATDFDTIGPNANFKNSRTLPPEADQLLADFYQGNVMMTITDYFQRSARKAEYTARAGEGGQRLQNFFEEAGDLGAGNEAIAEIRRVIDLMTGHQRNADPSHWNNFLGWVYVTATVRLLDRAVYASLAEPITAGVRLQSPMAALRALGSTAKYIGSLGYGQKNAALRDLAQVMGMVTSAQYETLMHNRYGGDLDPSQTQGWLLGKFFQWNGLTKLTNTQRISMLSVSQWAIKNNLRDAAKSKGRARRVALAELADLGISEDDAKGLYDWMMNDLGGRLPGKQDLVDVDGQYFNRAARIWSDANVSLVEQIIQNPKRYHRPPASMSGNMRLAYGITGFIFSFHSEVLVPMLRRNIQKSDGKGKAAVEVTNNLLRASPAIAALMTLQGLAWVLRIAMTDPDKFDDEMEDLDDDDKLYDLVFRKLWQDNTMQLVTRSGVLGAFDIPYNMIFGVRFGRDLTGHIAGPHVAVNVEPLEKIIALGSRNTPSTNRSEYDATESVLEVLVGSAMGLGLSAIRRGGPLADMAKFGLNSVEEHVHTHEMMTEYLLGERGRTYRRGQTPWWEMGEEKDD